MSRKEVIKTSNYFCVQILHTQWLQSYKLKELQMENLLVERNAVNSLENDILISNLENYEKAVKKLLSYLTFDYSVSNAVLIDYDIESENEYLVDIIFNRCVLSTRKAIELLEEPAPGGYYIDVIKNYIDKYNGSLTKAINNSSSESELFMALWCLKGIYQ